MYRRQIAVTSCLTLHILRQKESEKATRFKKITKSFYFKFTYIGAGLRLLKEFKFKSLILAQNERWRQV